MRHDALILPPEYYEVFEKLTQLMEHFRLRAATNTPAAMEAFGTLQRTWREAVAAQQAQEVRRG